MSARLLRRELAQSQRFPESERGFPTHGGLLGVKKIALGGVAVFHQRRSSDSLGTDADAKVRGFL